MTLDLGKPKRPPPPKDSRALIASDGNGNGCVISYVGEGIHYMLSETSQRLDDIGLDDAPQGLRIWEGRARGGEVTHGLEGTDYGDVYLVGAFRELTSLEWDAVIKGRVPWHVEDWPEDERRYASDYVEPEVDDVEEHVADYSPMLDDASVNTWEVPE